MSKDTAYSQSAEAVLADARAMLAAAQADHEVSARLGRAYLSRVAAQISRAESAISDGQHAAEAQAAESGHVAETAAHLLVVMQEIRDAVELAEQPAEVQTAFGRGAHWDATKPDALANAGRNLAAAIASHSAVVRAASIDAQHRHDLTELSSALGDAHTHHVALRSNRGDTTAARGLALATLRASAHHIRLAARLVHRREPQKLAHFASPVAHHRVEHHSHDAPTAAKPATP